MSAAVRVLPQEEFDAWIRAESGVSEDPVERGAQWAEQFGCLVCHSVDGTPLVGPSWQGLYGREEELQDGTTVVADEAYLHNSIVDPQSQIVAGFPNAMPPAAAAGLTDEQIADIIAFIESLR
jgi:cytochrome c oxidase subunit 2